VSSPLSCDRAGETVAFLEQLDRPLLRPLPATRYEVAEWRDATVNIDYHVVVESNYYSVPYQLLHQRVEVRLAATTVEIFSRGGASPPIAAAGAGASSAPTRPTCLPPTAPMPSGHPPA
jgi:hypothetical protein